MMSAEEVHYSVTISYYQRTGSEFANHLKDGLEDVGIKTFLDARDIPKTVESGSDKWRSYINRAIIESNKFILIMTFGFNTRNEVIRELVFSWNNKKDVILCKDINLPKDQMIIRMEGKEIDLSELEYILFTDKEDLLRKVGGILFDAKSIRHYNYINRINKIIAINGIDLKQNDYPIMEIVMVPVFTRNDLLEANDENDPWDVFEDFSVWVDGTVGGGTLTLYVYEADHKKGGTDSTVYSETITSGTAEGVTPDYFQFDSTAGKALIVSLEGSTHEPTSALIELRHRTKGTGFQYH